MRVQLFATCLIDTLYPETGESTIRLLREFGVEVGFPKGQTCCGKPADSGGYREQGKPPNTLFRSFKEAILL